MSERPDPNQPEDSILGSLPRSRPGVRSPRRDAAARARARRKPAPTTGESPADEGPAPTGQPGANLEEIARAGVTTATQVAAAGLRFAGRAAGAIRESLERR